MKGTSSSARNGDSRRKGVRAKREKRRKKRKKMEREKKKGKQGKSLKEDTLLQNTSVAWGSDCSNGNLVTRCYNGSSVMSLNHPSLLWPSVVTGAGDNTSSLIATVTSRGSSDEYVTM
jgi:hypothetical protein